MVGDAHLIVAQVTLDLFEVSDGLERVGQEVDIRLLDVLPVVPVVLLGHVVLHLQDYDLLGNLSVVVVSGKRQDFGRSIVQPERLLGHSVGKGIVVNVLRPLVRSHHVLYVVVAVLAKLNSALPELGHR